ncbi:MAG: hypothetical protein JWM47_239 [Acidimicrobiales bacterium]|nr:hypothetical protein [Acidimicrobiales bacterium]
MALYVTAGARRRRTIVISVATMAAGLVFGLLIGRATAPTANDRIRSIQTDARQTASGLRVISLHDESGAISTAAPGDGGVRLVLARTRAELTDELDRAIWVSGAQRRQLLGGLDALVARKDEGSAAFGRAAEVLAERIDATFGAQPT